MIKKSKEDVKLLHELTFKIGSAFETLKVLKAEIKNMKAQRTAIKQKYKVVANDEKQQN